MSKAETLMLPDCVDAAASVRLWRELGARAPATIDFGAVREIDSSGLALVAELARRGAGHGSRVALANVPERFVQLCAAHRIDKELLS